MSAIPIARWSGNFLGNSSLQQFLVGLANNAVKFGLESPKISTFSLDVSAPKASPMQETIVYENVLEHLCIM